METTITFVLGALCGLFLLGMVYAFIGVLKTQKEIKNLKHDYRYVKDQMGMMDNSIRNIICKNDENVHNRIEELLRDLEQQRQDEVRRSNDDYQNLRKLLDDTNRYVDKRVDNSTTNTVQYIDKKIDGVVDILCTRMDLNNDQLIKS